MPMPWYHESPAHLHVGTLETGLIIFPHATAAEALDTPEQSARCRVLDGEWAFQYYGSVHELPPDFPRRLLPAGGRKGHGPHPRPLRLAESRV